MPNVRLPLDSVQARNVSSSVTLPDASFMRYRSSEVVLPSTRGPVVARAPIAPLAPVIAGKILTGPQLSFHAFLSDEDCANYCRLFLGEEASSAATLLSECSLGTEFNYFGPRNGRGGRNAGKLDESNSATKDLLQQFVRRAYQGDREGRGVDYWVDITSLFWNAYSDLMARREELVTINARAKKRSESLVRKRALTAERVRRFREKQRNSPWVSPATDE
jgi:hypothetical protein